MIIYDWPTTLVANAEMFRIDARTRSGGETITGREQAVSSGLGRWVARLTVPLHTPAKIRAMRSLLAKLEGRTNAVRVGPCDCRNGSRLIPVAGDIPYSDKAVHTDGAGFMQGGVVPYVTETVTAAAAARGVCSVKIMVGSTMVPIPEGVHIGLAGRLYVVVGYRVLENETAQLEIRPRLRLRPDDPLIALPEGEPVLWRGARAPMRLTTDDSGEFELQLARMGTATLDLVEVW